MSESTSDIIERNRLAVEAHFHNENPENVDKAVELYTDDIVWEAPARGQVYRSGAEVKEAYLNIFKTTHITKMTLLREVVTETSVFTDHISEAVVVGDKMPNLPYPIGTKVRTRLVHMFEMRDGKIAREIAYEIWREADSGVDVDDVPADAVEVPL
ncbi:nuclear transport factor 2 family protein [Saccharopolyspora sp. 5N708]|uniref:nuclear transport factor 2 family protein n=1 Tax=Saccharopolyspora sp. 5N708 TaxID=3457424 RepID=UPI003FD3CB69